MIKITNALNEKLSSWGSKEWHKVDQSHYGHRVEWNEKKFKFKAVEKNKIVGLISGKHESGVLYINTIITKESERGKGIGTKLIKRAIDFGKKCGAHRVWLITGKDWSENAFYKKIGFKKIATLPDFHFHKDFVIYIKDIT